MFNAGCKYTWHVSVPFRALEYMKQKTESEVFHISLK